MLSTTCSALNSTIYTGYVHPFHAAVSQPTIYFRISPNGAKLLNKNGISANYIHYAIYSTAIRLLSLIIATTPNKNPTALAATKCFLTYSATTNYSSQEHLSTVN